MFGSLCFLVCGEEVKDANISHKKLVVTWKLIRIKLDFKEIMCRKFANSCWFVTIVISMFITSGINEWCTFVAKYIVLQ